MGLELFIYEGTDMKGTTEIAKIESLFILGFFVDFSPSLLEVYYGLIFQQNCCLTAKV